MILDDLDEQIFSLISTSPKDTCQELSVDWTFLKEIHNNREATWFPNQGTESIKQSYQLLFLDGLIREIKLRKNTWNYYDPLDCSYLKEVLQNKGLQTVKVSLSEIHEG